MASPRFPASNFLVSGQMILIAAALSIGLAPPAQGVMLIAPVLPSSQGETMRWAEDAGGRLVARGPYDGALFVAGERAPLVRAALLHGAIIMRASGAGCGAATRDPI